MATRDPNDHNTKVYDRNSSKKGWGIGALVAILAIGLIAWWAWPDGEDVAVTGAVPPPAVVEAPVVPPAAAPEPVVPPAAGPEVRP